MLEAGRTGVARDGYDGTSIAEIAEAAGFSKGAFFSNFASKEALLLELLRRHKEQDIAVLREIFSGVGQGQDIESALDRYLVALNDNADWLRLDIELQRHAARNAAFAADYDRLQQQNRSALGELLGILFARDGRQPPVTLNDLADLLVALVQGLVLQRTHDPGATVKLVVQALVASAQPVSEEPAAAL